MEKTAKTAEREGQEKILKEAEDFLEELGITESINKVLASEESKAIIRNEYEHLSSKITKLKDSVPPELRVPAEVLAGEYTGHLDKFEADVVANFKIRLHMSFYALPEVIQDACKESIKMHLSKEDDEKKSVLEDVDDISKELNAKLQSAFLELIYANWVPEGIPAEVAEFIKMIGGGKALVPATAIFPELKDLEDDLADDAESESVPEDECDSDGEAETDSVSEDECDSDGEVKTEA